jgi:hypothetical protein
MFGGGAALKKGLIRAKTQVKGANHGRESEYMTANLGVEQGSNSKQIGLNI